MINKFKFFEGIIEDTFIFENVNVEADIRPIRAIWTPQLIADLGAYHGIDAEAELTRLLSEQIAIEANNHIINQMRRLIDEDELAQRITRRINGRRRR